MLQNVPVDEELNVDSFGLFVFSNNRHDRLVDHAHTGPWQWAQKNTARRLHQHNHTARHRLLAAARLHGHNRLLCRLSHLFRAGLLLFLAHDPDDLREELKGPEVGHTERFLVLQVSGFGWHLRRRFLHTSGRLVRGGLHVLWHGRRFPVHFDSADFVDRLCSLVERELGREVRERQQGVLLWAARLYWIFLLRCGCSRGARICLLC